MDINELKDDGRVDMIAEMLSKCRIDEQKPWPDFVHIDPLTKNSLANPRLIATLDVCPFPASSNLIPFPFFTVDQKNAQLSEVLFNKAMGVCASIPSFVPIPILLPPFAAMLTGKPNSIMLVNMKAQQRRFVSIFKKIYNTHFSSHDKDEETFLQTKTAKKLRFMHQELGMKIRSRERLVRKFRVQSWKPIQSSVTIFLFYSKIMDIIRQSNGFTSEENVEEFERYTALIKKADEDFKILNNFQAHENQTKANPAISAAVDYLKTNSSFFKSTEAFVSPLEKKMNNAVHGDEGALLKSFEKEAIQFVRDFTIQTLANMECWIMHVCGIPSEFHAAISLKRQPFPIGANVDLQLLKEMEQQLFYLQKIRFDAYSTIWSNTSLKPVLFLPESSPYETTKKEREGFLLEIFETLTRTLTSYEVIVFRVLRQSETVHTKVNREHFDSNTFHSIKWYPNSSSRFKPLSVFSSI